MKTIAPASFKLFVLLIVLTAFGSSSSGDIVLDSGTVSTQAASGGGFLGGTSTFNLTDLDPLNVNLLANFNIVDAGLEIRINGTSLFPLFNDFSQFSPNVVFLDTGVTQGNGNIESPFSANSSGLARLIVDTAADDTIFSGAAFVNSIETIDYTPNFVVQDFSSLLVSGDNTIEFFVLNSFQGANLQGDFTVTFNETTAVAVPEPSSAGLILLACAICSFRRRR